MKLMISCGAQLFEMETAGSGDRRKVSVGDREVSCDFVRLPDGNYSLILEGRVYDLSVELDTDACSVAGRAGRHLFRISDSRRLGTRSAAEEGQSGLQRICAEMPGKVVRLLVKEGDTVEYEQSLLVLEAMKMQNEIRSPKKGVVREIAAREGRAVNSGDFLLSIE